MTFILIVTASVAIQAQTTSFTYQGRLTDASMPAMNGTYDFEFALFDAASIGTQIGTVQNISAVAVNNGVFNIQLDFGAAAFSGADRYLEIRVKKPADSAYTTLSPRQKISSTPYSIRSLSAATADTATNATNAANATNAEKLGNVGSSGFVQTSTNDFIRNQTTQQAISNFNISGTGKANIFDATTQYNIDGVRVLSVAGLRNLFAGFGAGAINEGTANSFFGIGAGKVNTSGSANSFFGSSAGDNNTKGNANSFFGNFSGLANTTGSNNSFFGTSAGYNNQTGGYNSFFGNAAGFNNQTGGYNSFVGSFAGGGNTSGSNNSFFGYFAGSVNSEGNYNSFFGDAAGFSNGTGGYNAFFGSGAGNNNGSGGNNTMIGSGANVGFTNLSFATAIGSNAMVSTSNTIVLGRASGLDKVRIFGLGAAGSTHLCRNVDNEISTCTTQAALAENNGGQNAAEIKTLREQVKQQQQQIDALVKLVCSQNTKAEVCKQEK